MKTLILTTSICLLLLSGCESNTVSEPDAMSIYAEKLVGKWRLGESLEVREFTENGHAFVYNIEEGPGALFQYFDADESQIRFYYEEDLSGEYWNFPYRLESDPAGNEHLILTVIHPEGQGYLDCDYTRIE